MASTRKRIRRYPRFRRCDHAWWRSFQRAWWVEAPRLYGTDRIAEWQCFTSFDGHWILNFAVNDDESATIAMDALRDNERLRRALKRWPSEQEGLLRVVIFRPQPELGPVLLWSCEDAAFVVGAGQILKTGAGPVMDRTP